MISVAELMIRSRVGFGTSGARGLVVDLSPPVCYVYTRGFLQYLASHCHFSPWTAVAIAGDLRPSTPAIMAAIAAAVEDAGYRPINCGFLPSPAVASFGIANGIPSLMVTGSHIPDDRNGVKFNTPAGEILKADEAGIQAQTVEVPDTVRTDALPAIDGCGRADYVRRYLDFFPADALAGMRVAVYEHSGVARDILAEVLTELGAEVIRLGRSEVFIPVDTEAIRDKDVALARDWAAHYGFDAIVSTDGDADRPLLGTASGAWLRGDVLCVLCARALGIAALATPVTSNTVVERSAWFERVERTRIGSPYVIEAMQRLLADGCRSVAGYEANGGFLLATDLLSEGCHLAALPTRDALLPILTLLIETRRTGLSLAALTDQLPARHTASDRLKNFPAERARALIETLTRGGASAIDPLFGEYCGALASTDTTDGLRMSFANGEIVHLRPSGNAPEFRCYTEAADEGRAKELNATCLASLSSMS